MNDEEIKEMMHHIHVLNKTENKEEITFEEFYDIVSKKLYWWIYNNTFFFFFN